MIPAYDNNRYFIAGFLGVVSYGNNSPHDKPVVTPQTLSHAFTVIWPV